MTTIERLEKWKQGHKSRSVSIDIDDGYGATCWVVKLRGNGKVVIASEVSFYEYDFYENDKNETAAIPENIVFVLPSDSDEDWPGLEPVMNAAIDRAEKLGL